MSGQSPLFLVISILFLVVSLVLLSVATVYGVLKFDVPCATASKYVHPGEQNLCAVQENETKVKVKVNKKNAVDFTHYLFDEEPEISSIIRSYDYRFNSEWVDAGSHISYVFALPKGSKISAKLTSYSGLTHWYLTYTDVDEISPFAKWDSLWDSGGWGTQTFSLTMRESRTVHLYCFLQQNDDSQTGEITKWEVSVDYTTYDLSSGVVICSSQPECEVLNASGKYIVSTLRESASSGKPGIKGSIFVGEPKRKMRYFIPCLVVGIVVFIAGIVFLVVFLV